MKHHIRQIHKTLHKYSPEATKKAKKAFHIKYHKILILTFSIIISYFIFKNNSIAFFIENLQGYSYIGIFIAGMLLAMGFSAPFAVGFFIVSHPENLILATVIGGIGASISDLLIFKFIRFSFMNEFNELKKTSAIKKIREIFNNSLSIRIRHYFLYVFAGIMIATPLPDEIGVSMLAGLTTIKQKVLAIISFILHFLAIFIILRASI
jgi:hypothetical protein